MAITVFFFGQLVEITGSGELTIGENEGLNGSSGMNEINGSSAMTAITGSSAMTEIHGSSAVTEITGSSAMTENNGSSAMTENNGSTAVTEITGTKQLKEVLFQRFPRLADIVFNIAVDAVIIEGDVKLKRGSSVAFLPPFSGG
jgi:molybdopterin converting factor small subunit